MSENTARMLTGKLFGLAGKPVDTFPAVVERLQLIESLCNEMAEETGEILSNEELAKILYGSLDFSCSLELGTLRVMVGEGDKAHTVDTNTCP